MPYIYNIPDTWANTSNSYTAIGLEVTDTGSSNNSNLVSLSRNANVLFRVGKTGDIWTANVVQTLNNMGLDIVSGTANAGFTKANSAYNVATGSFNTANAAHTRANNGTFVVTNLDQLANVSSTGNSSAILANTRLGGTFVWNSANVQSSVAIDTLRGIYVAPFGATGSSGAWERVREQNIYDIRWFGAPVDKATNANTAIDGAIAMAAIDGGTVVFPNLDDDVYTPSFTTTSQHVFPVGVNIRMDGVLETSYSGANAAFVIGTASTYNHRVNLDISLTRASNSNWSDDNVVGVRIIRTNKSNIRLRYITGFTINAELIGDGGGFVHNQISSNELLDARIQIRCVAQNSGWFNRNKFLSGGRLGWSSGVNSTVNRYGIVMESPDGSFTINGNEIGIFDFEPSTGTFTEAVPVSLKSASINEVTFSDDLAKAYACRILGNSYQNKITRAYGNQTIYMDDKSLRGDNIFRGRGQAVVESNFGSWSSGFLVDKCVSYGGATFVTVAGHGGIATTLREYVGAAAITSEYLQLNTQGIVRRLHAVADRKYVLRRNLMSGYPGRVAIKCYDSSGTLLTGATATRANSTTYSLSDKVLFATAPYNTGGAVFECTSAGTSDSSEPTGEFSIGDTITDGTVEWTLVREPVVTQNGINPAYTAGTFGGCFRSGSDYAQDTMLLFSSDVSYADIIIAGGTAVCRIKGYDIVAADDGAVTTSHPLKLPDDMLVTYQSPQTSGAMGYDNLNYGTIVYDSSPVVGTVMGWVKTAAGDPGTWRELPRLPYGVPTANTTQYVTNLDQLANCSTMIEKGVVLANTRLGGSFSWTSANVQANVSADTTKTIYVPPFGTTGSSGAWVRNHGAIVPLESNTNLANAASGINTTDKYTGKLIIDTTNNRMLYASGINTTSPWYIVDGSGNVTPS